jgi:hypothetical protein
VTIATRARRLAQELRVMVASQQSRSMLAPQTDRAGLQSSARR